jgi:protein-disulfide isomerase
VPSLGNADGDVTIVEVVDYQCGYCKLCYFEIAKLVSEDAGIRVVLKDWPVFGPASEFAARAMLSIRDDALAYRAGADALMRNDGRLSPRRVTGLLDDAGVDVANLQARMNAQKAEIDAILLRNNAHAVDFGLRGTPAVLVGSRLFRRAMPLEDLRAAVAAARQPAADSNI